MALLLGTIIIISVILIITALGFLTTFMAGKLTETRGARTTGKIGLMVTLPLFLITLIGAINVNAQINNAAKQRAHTEKVKQQKQKALAKDMNLKFIDAQYDLITKLYLSASTAETLAGTEQKAWRAAIFDSNESFNIETAITKIESDNKATIDTLTSNLEVLEESIAIMSKNDTGKYDYAAYEKAYNSTRKFINFTTSISGSYSSFGTTYSELDREVADAIDALPNLSDN